MRCLCMRVRRLCDWLYQGVYADQFCSLDFFSVLIHMYPPMHCAQYVASNTNLLASWIVVPSALQCTAEPPRRTDAHVLYESEAWTAGLNEELHTLMSLPLLVTGLLADCQSQVQDAAAGAGVSAGATVEVGSELRALVRDNAMGLWLLRRFQRYAVLCGTDVLLLGVFVTGCVAAAVCVCTCIFPNDVIMTERFTSLTCRCFGGLKTLRTIQTHTCCRPAGRRGPLCRFVSCCAVFYVASIDRIGIRSL